MGVFGEYYQGESAAVGESGGAAGDHEPKQPVVDEPAAAVGDYEEGKDAAFEDSTDKTEEGD
jgi:hypothetical protein